MPIREVLHVPHPALRKKAHRVDDFDQELSDLLDDMVETMRSEAGVGLAGPQINVNQRVLVVEFARDTEEDIPPTVYTLVNPQITQFSSDTVVGAEGCLSIPGLMGDVERSRQITLQAQDRRGDPVKFKAQGWLARIFQHEVDHLKGILFTDRADQVWKIDEEEEYHAV